MVQLFETIMTAILAYMAYALYDGVSAPSILSLLVFVQVLFWVLDFLFIRGGMAEIEEVRQLARRLSQSMSRA
ncbi:MAG: hypothetical protein HY815_27460 [Candidatus Riflebacteria bacterium]|nr:hypothetical protein [Candidatus Riflebacteria bacterium]